MATLIREEIMKIKDIVKVRESWHSKFWNSYWKGNLQGKQGEIVEIVGQNGNIENYRVKFPVIHIKGEDGRLKFVADLSKMR